MVTTEIERIEVKRAAHPAKELKLLEVFVGKWNVEGENISTTPEAPHRRISGEQSYEWLPGGFFLVSGWDRRFENTSHRGLGVISFDATKNTFALCNYDNLGFARKYVMQVEGNIWKFIGEKKRGYIEFSNNGKNFRELWESSEDGNHWKALCSLKGTKVI